MSSKGTPPPALKPHVARKLLDLLSSDDGFRDLFQRDAHAALVEPGYEAPPGAEGTPETSGGRCMQLSSTEKLASKEQIARDRVKLEKSLALVQQFLCIDELKSDSQR